MQLYPTHMQRISWCIRSALWRIVSSLRDLRFKLILKTLTSHVRCVKLKRLFAICESYLDIRLIIKISRPYTIQRWLSRIFVSRAEFFKWFPLQTVLFRFRSAVDAFSRLKLYWARKLINAELVFSYFCVRFTVKNAHWASRSYRSSQWEEVEEG